MKPDFVYTPIEYLKGIGPQRGELLRKELNIHNFYDLITFYPFRYIDRTEFQKVNEVNEDGTYVQLKGRIIKIETLGNKHAKRMVAYFKDESGIIELIWFRGLKWLEGKFRNDIDYVVFGRVNEFNGRFSIPHPEIDELNEFNAKGTTALQPRYNSTEILKNRGLDSKGILKIQEALHLQLNNCINENLSDSILNRFQLIGKEAAWKNIHFPATDEKLKQAERRLKFEELFFIQLKLLKNKNYRKTHSKGFPFLKIGEVFNEFYQSHLPFPLTEAQKRVIKEIRNDLAKEIQMNRLLQGDVGSGKTIVALLCMLIAIDNGFQACLMAPTEILASQHVNGISQLLKNMNVQVALLTGNIKGKAREQLLNKLSSGEINILVGTHALIEEPVIFKNLGLAVIDEQHRFGVEQRAKLHKKNTVPPHVLVMTATPIPRTLSMTFYGDLDVSIIDELPPGRKPIKTIHMHDGQRLRMFGFIREQIQLGRQVYVVYPLIKESEKLDLKNLSEGFESIQREFPLPQYNISVVHGKMKNDLKEFEMQRFVKGETQIMVATTVIEVGVNVPNASIMIIENAERFGLSQLHQLRGRVGRGAEQSYCILMTSYKLGNDSKIRMETMCRTNDGFEISEVDLKLRGPGDIEGTQQSGIIDLKIANLATDQQIIIAARNAAQQLLDEDPEIIKPENAVIKYYIEERSKQKTNWSKIA